MLSVTRNKRGETTNINSGPPNAAPIVDQTYTYDPNVVGQVDTVNFFPGKYNAYTWTMGYDNAGELNAYTTNVRPNVRFICLGA